MPSETFSDGNYAFPIACLGICLLVFLAASGSSEAITSASTSSLMHCQKKTLITQAYIAVLMASTIFMYAFIIALAIVFKMSKSYDMKMAVTHAFACILYGVCAKFSGRSMAVACRHGSGKIAKQPAFFFSFVLVMS
ncbi:hypothetical protein COBT_001166, partial [Conglomerata obtusa]